MPLRERPGIATTCQPRHLVFAGLESPESALAAPHVPRGPHPGRRTSCIPLTPGTGAPCSTSHPRWRSSRSSRSPLPQPRSRPPRPAPPPRSSPLALPLDGLVADVARPSATPRSAAAVAEDTALADPGTAPTATHAPHKQPAVKAGVFVKPAPKPRVYSTAGTGHVLKGRASWYCNNDGSRAQISSCHYQYPDTGAYNAYAAAGPKLRAALGANWPAHGQGRVRRRAPGQARGLVPVPSAGRRASRS